MTYYTGDKITLAPCMRTMLLEETCRRFHIIKYCNYYFHLELKQKDAVVYKGTCPWCRKKEALLCNRITGTCFCDSCKKQADFFDIITNYWNFDLNFTLNLLAWQLEKAKEYNRAGTCKTSDQGGAV